MSSAACLALPAQLLLWQQYVDQQAHALPLEF
jgi:hypothetical protein